MTNLCLHCDLPFSAEHHTDTLCPECERIELAQYAPKPDLPFTPWRHARTVMQARLGTNTREDS